MAGGSGRVSNGRTAAAERRNHLQTQAGAGSRQEIQAGRQVEAENCRQQAAELRIPIGRKRQAAERRPETAETKRRHLVAERWQASSRTSRNGRRYSIETRPR